MKKLTATFVIAAVLLNAMAPTLAQAATHLQGAEVNANTLVKDAYVQVTYYDSKGEQKSEKGWINAVGETAFEIRRRALFGKETIAYDKVVSIIMSEESTTPIKQMNEVNRFIRERDRERATENRERATENRERTTENREQAAIQTLNHQPVTVMVRGQIDTSQVPWNAYVHVLYTSNGVKRTATGRVVNKTASSIITLQNIQQDRKISYDNIAYSNISYDNMDTLLVAKDWQDIDRYREIGAQHNAKVRVKAIYKKRVTGRVVKMTQDTLVIQSGRTFFQVPRSDISNFEVGVGKRRNAGKGFKIGAGIGLGIIAISILGIYTADDTEWDQLAAGYAFVYVALPGAALTTLTGTLFGAAIKTDDWVKVSPQRLNLSIAPTSTKGLRAALTFNF